MLTNVDAEEKRCDAPFLPKAIKPLGLERKEQNQNREQLEGP